MSEFLLPTLAVTAAALLVRAGVDHVLRRTALRALLDRQALLPHPLVALAGHGLGPLETTAGIGVAVALATATGRVAVGAVTTVLGLAFVAFLAALRRLRPGAPCGCHGSVDAPPGPLAALRGALVAAGGLALLAEAADHWSGLAAGERAVVVVAGIAVAATADVAAAADPRSLPEVTRA